MIAQGDWVHWVLALITLGWLLAIADQARRYSAQFEESVRLRFENEELIARLRQEKSVAEDASSAKSRFLAAASHDLRQPVHALSLFVAALRPRVTDREAARMLDHIDSSVQAMGGLFNGLLDISRLDAGVVEVNAQSFAIQPLLERICRDYAGDAAAKQIELRLRADARRRLQRSVAGGAHRAQHRRQCHRVHRQRARAGGLPAARPIGAHRRCGIPGAAFRPREQARIFQEFYQVGNPERDRGRGVGLGLAIVKRLTALLGHPLKLRSQPERGSVFTLELPYSDAPLAAPPRVLEVPETADGGAGLVLVVDDEAGDPDGDEGSARGLGLQAPSSRAPATRLLEKLADCPDRPGLIICDYRLRAHENGIHVIERLRSEYNDDEIPGMLITGDTAPDRLREAQESGLLLLHKPVSNSRLRARYRASPGASRCRSGAS